MHHVLNTDSVLIVSQCVKCVCICMCVCKVSVRRLLEKVVNLYTPYQRVTALKRLLCDCRTCEGRIVELGR